MEELRVSQLISVSQLVYMPSKHLQNICNLLKFEISLFSETLKLDSFHFKIHLSLLSQKFQEFPFLINSIDKC